MTEFQPLSESELLIMQAVWASGSSVSSSQIQNSLTAKHWKPTTILTFLSRLCDKGLLRAEKNGKSNRYLPLVSQEEYKQFETRAFLKQVHGGSVKSFLAALAEDDGITPTEIEELREWFNER